MSFKKRRHPTFGVRALGFGEVEQFPFYPYILSSISPSPRHTWCSPRTHISYLVPVLLAISPVLTSVLAPTCLWCLSVCRSCCLAAFGNQSGCFRSLGITNHASIICRSPHLENLQKYYPLSARVTVLMQSTPKVIMW